MRRREFTTLAVIAVAVPVLPVIAQTQTEERTMTTIPQTGFAPANGLELYYEIHGAGEPLLMLHGGIGATEQLGPNVAELARTRQVIVAHMQGHGFTRDIDRPYSLTQFADDVSALLDHLKITKADALGYSMGADVALRLAIQRPEKVGRLILVSGSMAMTGQYPDVAAAFPAMVANAAQIAAGVAASSLATMYPDVNWETAFRKSGIMASEPWDWSEEVGAITAPALLVFADADSIMPDHIMAMWGKFGGGQGAAGFDGSRRPVSRLAILPGRTHYDVMETTDVGAMTEAFLAAAQVG